MTKRKHKQDSPFERYTELKLLEALESDPETTQADLATRAGVAVGTVNWYMKRWSNKGIVKVKRIGRWRWRYLLTPQGIAEKADLANHYFQASMRAYRRGRKQAKELLEQVRNAGYETVLVEGEGDLAEIARLTALEMKFKLVDEITANQSPIVNCSGLEMRLAWPDDHE